MNTFDEVDVSPVRGFVTDFIELIGGHVYALLTPDGNYAKNSCRRCFRYGDHL